MNLTAEQVAGFSKTFLLSKYDTPTPIPDFHRQMWKLATSDTSRVVIVAPRHHAKAQSLASRVLTPTGWSTIGELEVGDRLIGSDGLPTEVVQLHPVADMDLYEIETVDGRKALCNDEHLWTVQIPQNTGNRLVTKSTKELLEIYKSERPSGKIEYKVYIPTVAPIKFETKELPIDPYVLGVWLGDGHSEGGRITSADPEIFNYFPYEVRRTESGKYLYRVVGLTTKLKSIDVQYNKHIPKEYMYGSVGQRVSLLQGLMDTDGTIHQDGKIAYFCNTNRLLIDQFVELVRSLGGRAVVNTNWTTCNGKRFISWRVSVKIAHGINPFKLSRKADKWKYCNRTRAAIVSIKKVSSGLARCITVSNEDGLYVTDDYLLTHNSTAITHAFILASVMFRSARYVLLVSDTEGQASNFLMDIKEEITSNPGLREIFGIKRFIKDAVTDIIVEMYDGWRFRVSAVGSEMKVRGRKWGNSRPDLIVGDDLENDEMVESQERREKFRNWFFKALVPALSSNGKIVIVGTILHLDSLLYRLLQNASWKNLFFKAHKSFDDFSELLWPDRWPADRLRIERDEKINAGMPEVYSQEYLNNPLDQSEAYFKTTDFLPMEESHFEINKYHYAGIDFAISDADRAAYTVIAVVGVDPVNNMHLVYILRFRGDADEIIRNMLAVQQKFDIQMWAAEEGHISKTLGPALNRSMQEKGVWLNINSMVPTKDKRARARNIQARMRAGSCYFNIKAPWFPIFQEEMLQFPKGQYLDQVDAFAWVGRMVDTMAAAASKNDILEEEYEESKSLYLTNGRNRVTGY